MEGALCARHGSNRLDSFCFANGQLGMNDHGIPILGIKPRKRDEIRRTVNYSFTMRKHWLNDRETVYHNEKNRATKSCDDACERNDIVAGGQAFD